VPVRVFRTGSVLAYKGYPQKEIGFLEATTRKLAGVDDEILSRECGD
jgi:hypothetical protein